MALRQTAITIDDFSGGITDYVLDAKPNQSSKLENLLINPNKKLETVPGSQVYDPAMFQIPTGNARVCSVFASAYPELIINSARKLWRPNSTVFTEFVGPSSNPAFSVGTTSDFASFAEWNEHIIATSTALANPVKLYKDGSGTWQTRTAGLPDLASAPTATPGVGTNNYVYAFCHYYTYTVGTTVFEDYGPTTLVPCNLAVAPSSTPIAIAGIPTLANGSTLNYDTTNVKIYIYRTIASGTVFYKVGSVTNGTATYSDTTSDTALQNGTLLYTNSGVLDNDPPPLAKYVHIVNGIAYYAHCQIGTQVLKTRIRQSIQDDPDSCPRALYIDVLDEITGISSYNDNPLVFTKSHVYRLNGQYNELGQGQVTYEDITKTIGCMSHASIVQTRYGVFWAGNDGFYWTDGFQFKKISDSINERYKLLVNTTTRKGRICGTYDPKDNRVHWAVTIGTSATDNDTVFTLDLRWGVRDDSTFTTRVNGTSFAPTAITFYAGQLIRGDTRGYLFKHDSTYTTDPKVDILVAPSLWDTKAIIPLYESAVSTLGMPNIRKWVSKILLSMQNVTNASVQINSINDGSSTISPLKLIRYRGNVLWGDPAPVWGTDDISWSFFNLIEEMRRFPSTSLRCSRKQIQITSAYSNIYNSDSISTGTVTVGSKTVVLTNGALTWPTDLVDYYISFEADGYVKDYQITSRDSATQITYLDALSSSTSGAQKWVIRGYPKGEIFNILAFTVYFAPISDQSFKTWRSEQDSLGTNA